MVRLLVFQINATFAIFLATFRGPTVFWNCGLKNSFSRTPFQTSYLFVMLELPCPQIYAMTSYKTKQALLQPLNLSSPPPPSFGFSKCFTKIQRPKSKQCYFQIILKPWSHEKSPHFPTFNRAKIPAAKFKLSNFWKCGTKQHVDFWNCILDHALLSSSTHVGRRHHHHCRRQQSRR